MHGSNIYTEIINCSLLISSVTNSFHRVFLSSWNCPSWQHWLLLLHYVLENGTKFDVTEVDGNCRCNQIYIFCLTLRLASNCNKMKRISIFGWIFHTFSSQKSWRVCRCWIEKKFMKNNVFSEMNILTKMCVFYFWLF